MTAPTCTSSHRMSPLPPGLPGTLATLLAGQPDHHVTATSGGGRFRYEAVRNAPGPGPWCVVSTDPADLWRELAPYLRPGAQGPGHPTP
jgi:hypothetical protein